MKRLLFILALTLSTFTARAAQEGDSMAIWLKDPAFKKLYSQALTHSPANHKNSWVYKDAQLGLSVAIPGRNANRWIRVATCASKLKTQCRLNHIEVFYDAVNQELFAYLTMGSRVGWIGGVRGPTSLEQKFFTPLLTARDIR
jgi:hypothetical protein